MIARDAALGLANAIFRLTRLSRFSLLGFEFDVATGFVRFEILSVQPRESR